jgi:hypothetical protein
VALLLVNGIDWLYALSGPGGINRIIVKEIASPTNSFPEITLAFNFDVLVIISSNNNQTVVILSNNNAILFFNVVHIYYVYVQGSGMQYDGR